VRQPPLAVYVHLPWCVSKCPYCDFNSHTFGQSTSLEEYAAALDQDLAEESAHVAGRKVDTVFIGGGTPSLFPPAQIAAILDHLRAQLTLSSDAEITMEANPGTVEHGNLRAYREAGVTRLSLGVQSFDAESLRRLGRIHGPEEVEIAYREARQAGFASINIDLMFALPGQTPDMAQRDIERAIALGVEHISYYQLTLEPNTVFFARPPSGLPDDDRSYALQETSFQRLSAAGYERYEVSAFCQPGQACRHNLNYWSFGDYLGVGAGAHGKITDSGGRIRRTLKTAHPASYLREASGEGIRRQTRALDGDDIAFEFMLNALRLEAGFSLGLFTARTGLPAEALEPRLRAAEAAGLMARGDGDTWRPSELGFRFLNDLQARFLPDDNRAAGEAVATSSVAPSPAVMHKSRP